MASNSLKGGLMPMEEHLLLKEMHMKNSITITPSKPTNKHEKKKFIEPVQLTPAWEEKNLPNDILNFKSVTMERANLETNPPKDRYMIVYFIILIHGIGVLMPWNMFITAKAYFEDYKLGANYTAPSGEDTTFYVRYFMTFISVFGQLPNVVFNWVNIFINFGGSLTSRIVYSIIFELFLFIITEVLVLLDSSTWPILFFWVTMLSVFILNVVNGIYQSTIYGVAARLPPAYTGAVVIGNNISGTFATLISIATKVLSPNLRIAAIYYFIVALFVLFVCFDTYFILPLTKFYKYHDLQFQKAQEKKLIAAEENQSEVGTSYWKVFKACSLQCFNVFYIFFISLTLFPSVQSGIISVNPDAFFAKDLFVDITCYLTFNVAATVGSFLATFVNWPGPNRLHVVVLLRTVFIPLFLFCNYQVQGINRTIPVLIPNDYVYWTIGTLFAMSSGYLSSLGMMYCGKSVPSESSSIAGMFGAAFLVTGIFSGLLLAFIWPWVIRTF